MATKIISLDGLGKFKELLESKNAEKFADKQQFENFQTYIAENYAVFTTEQVNSMLNEIFG